MLQYCESVMFSYTRQKALPSERTISSSDISPIFFCFLAPRDALWRDGERERSESLPRTRPLLGDLLRDGIFEQMNCPLQLRCVGPQNTTNKH